MGLQMEWRVSQSALPSSLPCFRFTHLQSMKENLFIVRLSGKLTETESEVQEFIRKGPQDPLWWKVEL